MASIHHTTMTPTKLELLESWLPNQPWYRGELPDLTKVGGFRLDDPEGEVGIEFMVVTDDSDDEPINYLVPMTYRSAPFEDAEDALIGTSEHGVLGKRWIYDGVYDPVLLVELFALIQGGSEPQMQSVSDTPDNTVERFSELTLDTGIGFDLDAVINGPESTDLLMESISEDGKSQGQLILRILRILSPERGDGGSALGGVTANWKQPDGSNARGRYVVLNGVNPA